MKLRHKSHNLKELHIFKSNSWFKQMNVLIISKNLWEESFSKNFFCYWRRRLIRNYKTPDLRKLLPASSPGAKPVN